MVASDRARRPEECVVVFLPSLGIRRAGLALGPSSSSESLPPETGLTFYEEVTISR